MTPHLHRKTPTINAVDSRGLSVRQVAYCRRHMDDPAQARITRQAFDLAGRPVAQWDPRLSGDAPQANLTTVYSFSGKPLRIDSLDAGWRLNLPGDAGQILRCWDQRGHRWRTFYDDQLRPTEVQEQGTQEGLRRIECLRYGDSSPTSAAYNLCGALTRHDDSAGSLSISNYGLSGKPLGQARHFLVGCASPNWPADEKDRDGLLEPGNGYATSWRYDALGQPILQVDAAQHQQRYAFDVAGQLKAVGLKIKGSATEKIVVRELVYNASGQVESQVAGNGVISRAAFDPASGRLIALSAAVSGSTLQDLRYTYDAVGNVTQIEDRAQPVQFGSNQRVDAISTFSYDSLYQLISATGRESSGLTGNPSLATLSRAPFDARQLFRFTEHYEYDAGGNLIELRHVRDRNHYTRTYNVATASNRLTSWNIGHSAPDVTVGFDDNGNQQTLGPGRTLEWNTRNQLAKVTLVRREDGHDDTERYCYDSNGQRVCKIQTTRAATVTHTREARYLPGLEIRTRPNERLEVITVQAGRCSVRYLHWTEGRPAGIATSPFRYSLDDHLGSSTMELDGEGWLISQESYLPYGGTAWAASRSAVEADYRTIRYSGKEHDASGLYYYGQRYYAPWLQRWISADPAGAIDGLNLYCMVGNNPVRYNDPNGQDKEEFNIRKEIAAYPNILSQVNNRLSTLNHQLYNSMSTKDITKSVFQRYAYNAFKNAASLGAGALAAPAGLVASWSAMSGTAAGIDSLAGKMDATRHLPESVYPQVSRLDPDDIEHEGRTAFYDLNAKSRKAIKDLDPREATGQKKISLMVTNFILTKVLRVPGAWIANFEASTQATKTSNGIPGQKIQRLNDALLELDGYLEHDANAINAAFDRLGVEEFYGPGAKGMLNRTLDQMTDQTGTAGARTLRRTQMQQQINATRATIQRGRELLFRLNQYNQSMGRYAAA
ncbi:MULTISPECIES: RHS repeat-associated core domain-containing protein [Pseudomonas]|uniref:RHS repeat-associated core domain-containing protein n=1 Tax=Pseudomonas TaxID=286 RepID=UPI001BEBBDFE|nr:MULTISPECIES: RHS repeat-associated core domain-containing protein [Pseudomonas]MBT2341385.1 RHS repeat protein [Pseudomonas fluorescens]MCD4528969.1 RHS repeat protein [Pseudomonas sp. C3-2018]